MAIIIENKTPCALCGEALSDREFLNFPHFIQDEAHRLYEYSDSGMHRGCFLNWEEANAFVEAFNHNWNKLMPERNREMRKDGVIEDRACRCFLEPDVFYLENAPSDFMDTLSVTVRDWVSLYLCSSCDRYWAIDEQDKYNERVVALVPDTSSWSGATDGQRKELLLKSRGGVTNDNCIWKNCHAKTVQGTVYCLDHLYETGTRK